MISGIVAVYSLKRLFEVHGAAATDLQNEFISIGGFKGNAVLFGHLGYRKDVG